jgi:hypothetical protein
MKKILERIRKFLVADGEIKIVETEIQNVQSGIMGSINNYDPASQLEILTACTEIVKAKIEDRKNVAIQQERIRQEQLLSQAMQTMLKALEVKTSIEEINSINFNQ